MNKTMLCLLLGLSLGIAAQTAQSADFKDLSRTLKTPITLDAGDKPDLHVTFNHASHKGIKCGFCHHERPANGKAYASCGGSEECHAVKTKDKDDVQSLFWAYHNKDSQRSCYGCHTKLAAKHAALRGCRPCHSKMLDAKDMQK